MINKEKMLINNNNPKMELNQATVTFIFIILYVVFSWNSNNKNVYFRHFFYDAFSATSVAHSLMVYNGTLANALHFYYLIHKSSTTCRKIIEIGSKFCQKNSDSAKELCMEPELIPVGTKNCTLLSFGLDDDMAFEDELYEAFECQTHIFDPTTFYQPDFYKNSTTNNTFHPIGFHQHQINLRGLRLELEKLRLHERKIHFVKISMMRFEWEVLQILLDLKIIERTSQLTFTSHLNVLKFLHVSLWRSYLQKSMRILESIEKAGLKRLYYKETRNFLSSIQFPGDDLPRPGCGRFLYLRK